ncbi:hypothetical protein [uncultured Algimonas sp.]|uniref:hypothetical protein n=1 Tax=uncultured Algimonas sp. TaxID=1547920 RepID=UPI00261D0DB8|nr:hypothetical protein [uncultured Algimonas sp.]
MEDSGEAVLPATEDGSPSMTFVEFSFGEDKATFGTFENSIVNADDLDRMVIWYADGTNARFEDDISIQSGETMTILADSATFPSSVQVGQEDNRAVATRSPG